MKKILTYFSRLEKAIWLFSVFIIMLSFFLFDGKDYLTMAASVLGVTSIIFCSKGNPIGQVLMMIFSLIYGAISYNFAYYGEMITYIGMTLPMAVISLISWLRNPYNGKRSEVKVNSLGKKDYIIMWLLMAVVTTAFYFILAHFNTANLIPSTISVTTSFVAVYLTFRRCPLFALAYAMNDVVLIVLWSLASTKDSGYISVIACFVAFLINDIYCFVSWLKLKKRQAT